MKITPENNLNNNKTILTNKINLIRFLFLIFILFIGIISCFISFHFISIQNNKSNSLSFISLINDNYNIIQQNLYLKLKLNLQNTLNFQLHCSIPSSHSDPPSPPSSSSTSPPPHRFSHSRDSNWPNCSISSKFYSDISKLLMDAGDIEQFLVLPIVKNEEKISFENYVRNEILADGNYPKDTGVSSFGSGKIFEYNSTFQRIPSINHSIYVPITVTSKLSL